MKISFILSLFCSFLSFDGFAWEYCGTFHRQAKQCVNNTAPSGRKCLYDASIGECYDWEWQGQAWPDNCGTTGLQLTYANAWMESEARQNAISECEHRPSPCGKSPSQCHIVKLFKFHRS